MAAQKFTRNKDYSDEANNNAGGRDTVDCAGLDGEMDEIVTTTDDHADKLDILLRGDLKMQDNILEGHEFSAVALSVLMGLLNQTGYINYRQDWATATDYIPGDLVTEPTSGNTYFCLVANTSGTFATDLAALKWHLFVPAGSSGIPALVANRVLGNNGAVLDWRTVGTTEAPTLAPLASPTFTGTVTLANLILNGSLESATSVVTFAAGGNTFDFDGTFLKAVAMTSSYTGACATSNRDPGKMQEIHFWNNSGSPVDLLWPAWTWMGYAPASLGAGKFAVLSLRSIWGTSEADVIATWTEEI